MKWICKIFGHYLHSWRGYLSRPILSLRTSITYCKRCGKTIVIGKWEYY